MVIRGSITEIIVMSTTIMDTRTTTDNFQCNMLSFSTIHDTQSEGGKIADEF